MDPTTRARRTEMETCSTCGSRQWRGTPCRCPYDDDDGPTNDRATYKPIPNIEVFHNSQQDFLTAERSTIQGQALVAAVEEGLDAMAAAAELAGWYWWSCSPGCLPDTDPVGPFDTEAIALADARNPGD